MSDSDEAERRHDVPGAIRARLKAIQSGDATWQDYHQMGVNLSQLAESAWRIGGQHWAQTANNFLVTAERYFETATQLAGTNELDLFAISCDRELARARWHWFDPDTRYSARESMTNITVGLNALGARESEPAVNHQLAIAHGLLARLAWGDMLGFNGEENSILAAGNNARATMYFAREAHDSPDNKRAYRAQLLAMALAYGMFGDGERRRSYAALAASSAEECGDRFHAYRARFIQLLGNAGERFLRWRRDRETIKALLRN